MKIMISQPFAGKTQTEINFVRENATKYLKARGHEVIDTDFSYLEDDLICNFPIFSLGESIKAMSYCDAVYFCKGWEKHRGCVIEHLCAIFYGLKTFYEYQEEL